MTRSTTLGALSVLQFYRAKTLSPVARRVLLDEGVAKGTVSKVVTVLNALNRGILAPEQVTSLGGAYELVRSRANAYELINATNKIDKVTALLQQAQLDFPALATSASYRELAEFMDELEEALK